MNKVLILDKALKYQNITKTEFAQKSNIPYDIVERWYSTPKGMTKRYVRNLSSKSSKMALYLR